VTPEISIIVVSWNGENVILNCLESLLAQSFSGFEIIVIDNGSRDRTREKIRSLSDPRIILRENRENLGFAAANNLGLDRARGRYLALFNQDARADRHWLSELLRLAESNPRAGMIASKVLRPGVPPTLDSAGLVIYPDGLNRTRGGGEPDSGQYDQIEEVFAPSGSAAFYRREMLARTGFFDPTCFLYGEDIDLGFRGRLQGWTCLYQPRASVFHPDPARPALDPRRKIYFVERNRIRLALKYLPFSALVSGFFYSTPKRYLFQGLSYRNGRGPAGAFRRQGGNFFDLVRLTLRAHFSIIPDIPSLLSERIRWKRERRVSPQEILSWFRKFGISARRISDQN